jgi:Protein of unknown function (DUF3768)
MGTSLAKADLIRFWNDHLRKFHRGGKVLLTQGVASLDAASQENIIKAVSSFDQFTPDNDPHHEHDCAILSVAGHRIMFKIDYYDPTMLHGSDNPSDPKVTTRVMTIMLTEEY